MKGTTCLGVCLAAVTLVVAGCGDDSDQADTDPVEAGEDAAGEDTDDEHAGHEHTGGDSDGGTAGGSVELVTPAGGSEVTSPFEATMDADDVEITEGGMHFHLIVDAGCVDPGEPIPATDEDERYLHYGDGSDEVEVDLEPGDHELCLQVGNAAHIAQDVTDEASITVTD